MKGKMINKARLAGAVMLATAGVAVGTAQADSLLAPLVISDTGSGIETYLAMKMRGQGISDQFTADGGKLTSPIHYYHIQKTQGMSGDPDMNTPVTSVPDLHTYAHNGGCKVTNTSGHGSSWDMIFQQVTSDASTNPSGTNTNVNPADNSVGGGWLRAPVAGDSAFYGMMIIDDVANLASLTGSNGRRDNEGNFSGFAYVVNNASGLMFDYKLLNNPFTKRTGDFKTNWISKTSIDWMWLPATNTRSPNPISPLFVERTSWYTAVTGEGMSLEAEQGNGRWDEQVMFTQSDQKDAENITSLYAKNGADAAGAYNNDEQVLSGVKNYKVKCLGLYDRSDFLTTQQFIQTANGGWKRSHIVPVSHSGRDNVRTHGAITYRLDDLNGYQTGNTPATIGGGPDIGITFQVETSGHLSTSVNKSHPNRGY